MSNKTAMAAYFSRAEMVVSCRLLVVRLGVALLGEAAMHAFIVPKLPSRSLTTNNKQLLFPAKDHGPGN